MASSCLELPPPVSGNRRKTDPYLSKVMFCLIQNYKQEITNIEKQLAHQVVSWIYKYEIIKMIKKLDNYREKVVIFTRNFFKNKERING